MAINQINTADFDYAMMLNVINVSYKTQSDITISNYDNDAAPQVTAGSIFANNGAIFENTTLATPTNYAGISNSTIFYLYYDESEGEFTYAETVPAWSDAKQDWYNGNDRAFFIMFKDSGGTLYENKMFIKNIPKLSKQILHIQDQKPNNTEGGTFNLGAWRTRTLNTILTNNIIGASLSSDQITLLAGIYKINARAPGYQVTRHKAKLRNITDGTDDIIGSNAVSVSADNGYSDSIVRGIISIDGTKVFELQHQCESNGVTRGFGYASNFSVIEVYSDIMIEKIG